MWSIKVIEVWFTDDNGQILTIVFPDELGDRQGMTRAVITSAVVPTGPMTLYLEACESLRNSSYTTTRISTTPPATYPSGRTDSGHEQRASHTSLLQLPGDLIDSPRQTSLMVTDLPAEEDPICIDTAPNAHNRSNARAKHHQRRERREERDKDTDPHGRRRCSTRNRLRKKDLSRSQQPIETSHLLCRFSKKASKHVDFLARFTASFAAPEAFSQLTATLNLVRDSDSLRLPPDSSSVAAKMSHLNTTVSLAPAGMMLRRFGLVQLRKYHKTVECRISHRTVSGRRDTAVLDHMLRDLCTEGRFNGSKEDRKKLRNQLCAGRNWEAMGKQFGIGSICLAPSGGEQKIWNQR
jgi:hypothetical protein